MSVSRKCDEPSCRKRYIAKRADSRFCSPACRQRAARSSKPATKLEVVPDAVVDEVETDRAEDEVASSRARRDGPVAASTRAELVAADRLETALGQSALALAKRLDAWTSHDTGSSLGSLAKALADLLAQATKGSGTGEGDPVTELKKRREERRRRGA